MATTTAKYDHEDLLQTFAEMTVLELSDFKTAFEQRFGVTAAVAVAPQQTGNAPAPVETVDEQTEFSVVLKAAGAQKIQVIKAVREVTSLGLKDAKDLVDAAPKVVKSDLSRAEADRIAAVLTEQGAEVAIE